MVHFKWAVLDIAGAVSRWPLSPEQLWQVGEKPKAVGTAHPSRAGLQVQDQNQCQLYTEGRGLQVKLLFHQILGVKNAPQEVNGQARGPRVPIALLHPGGSGQRPGDSFQDVMQEEAGTLRGAR